MSGLMDILYQVDHIEKSYFGNRWIGPEKFEHGKWVCVAQYFKTPEGDGQSVDVECAAFPARFYKIKVHPGENSIGEKQEGWILKTGSDMGELTHDIASAISDGILGYGGTMI